jgi:hypothetical protein
MSSVVIRMDADGTMEEAPDRLQPTWVPAVDNKCNSWAVTAKTFTNIFV